MLAITTLRRQKQTGSEMPVIVSSTYPDPFVRMQASEIHGLKKNKKVEVAK